MICSCTLHNIIPTVKHGDGSILLWCFLSKRYKKRLSQNPRGVPVLVSQRPVQSSDPFVSRTMFQRINDFNPIKNMWHDLKIAVRWHNWIRNWSEFVLRNMELNGVKMYMIRPKINVKNLKNKNNVLQIYIFLSLFLKYKTIYLKKNHAVNGCDFFLMNNFYAFDA